MIQSKFSVVKQPYDSTLEENMSMYDKLPYKRNADMCNASTLALVSGNLIKFYRCNYHEPREIDTQDDHFNAIVSNHLKRQEKELQRLHEHFPTIYQSLQDNSEEEPVLPEDNTDFNE